jgi:hypothetical protein
MLSRCQISIRETIYSGNLAGQNAQAKIRNLSFHAPFAVALRSLPNAGQSGAGLDISRIQLDVCSDGLTLGANVALNTVLITNSVFFGCYLGASMLTVQGVYNCIARACGFAGITLALSPGRNLIAAECGAGGDFAGGANLLNCVSTDTSTPLVATNLRLQDTRTQIKLFLDHVRPGDKAFNIDHRIHHDSVCNGRGVAVAGVTYDGDHQLRPNPPSIGPYEPYSTCYAPAAEIINGARKRGAHPCS